MTLLIDPNLFQDASISAQTKLFNDEMVALLEAGPDMWSVPVDLVRQNRLEGKGPFPLAGSPCKGPFTVARSKGPFPL